MRIIGSNQKWSRTVRLSVALAVLTSAAGAMGQVTKYSVADLGPVGPPPGQAYFVASNGLVAGAVAGAPGHEHGRIWYHGASVDLNAFKPNLNSVTFGVNSSLVATGEAETGVADPLKEDYCGFKALGFNASGSSCLPVVWKNGVAKALPTLGGNNGTSNMINALGEAAGAAETSTPDANCPLPQVLSSKAVVWVDGKVQALPTIGSDLEGVALAVNLSGQAVGGSGDCAPFSPITFLSVQSLHAVLWQGGKAYDLGNLGGTGHGSGIIAENINNYGQVVGSSDLPGDFPFHAFLWTKQTGMKDLGTLDGDLASVALAINDSGLITGLSLDQNFNPRAVLWQNGKRNDLNSLVPPSSSLHLLTACSINAQGQITGFAVDKVTGEFHAYLATPVR